MVANKYLVLSLVVRGGQEGAARRDESEPVVRLSSLHRWQPGTLSPRHSRHHHPVGARHAGVHVHGHACPCADHGYRAGVCVCTAACDMHVHVHVQGMAIGPAYLVHSWTRVQPSAGIGSTSQGLKLRARTPRVLMVGSVSVLGLQMPIGCLLTLEMCGGGGRRETRDR